MIKGPTSGSKPRSTNIIDGEPQTPTATPTAPIHPTPSDTFREVSKPHPYPPAVVQAWTDLKPGQTPWPKSKWANLKPQQKQALETLGYNQKTFAATRQGDLRQLPQSALKSFEDLGPHERDAVATLGYEARTWNRAIETRQDLLAYPSMLEAFTKLRGFDETENPQNLKTISAKDVKTIITKSNYLFGLIQSPSGKRALAYLRDFHPESFTPEARATLTDEINHKSWYSFSNLGWVSAAEPAQTNYESWRSESGGADVVNDASGLSAALVFDTVNVQSEEHLQVELARARFHGLKLNVAGARHSEGGHTCVGGSINVNMSGLNNVEVLANGDVKVGAGATWEAVIQELRESKVDGEEFNRTVQIMQASNVFSVGGSISVNCHGRTPNDGPLSTTVRSLKLLKPDGEIVFCDRQINPELFNLAIGGYGAAGVILEATLKTVPDRPVHMESAPTTVADFPAKMAEMIRRSDVELGYGRIDPSFTAASGDDIRSVEAALNFATIRKDAPITATEESGFDFEQLNLTFLERLVLTWSKWSNTNLNRRWELEEKMRSAGSDGRRSDFLDLGVGGLRQLPWNEGDETDILEELFIPFDPDATGEAAKVRDEHLIKFIESLRNLQRKHDNASLNITVRYVKNDEETMLPYTPDKGGGCLAFVLYYNQSITKKGSDERSAQQRDLFDLTTEFGGKVYLPYQMHYTREQLVNAYPNFDKADGMRTALDVDGVIANKLFSTYGKNRKA